MFCDKTTTLSKNANGFKGLKGENLLGFFYGENMASTKVAESFFELTGNTLRNTSMLRLFNILLDEIDRETKFVNLFKSFKINEDLMRDITFFNTYEVEGEGQAWWDNVSFDVYGTPFLWWMVALFNGVVNPFEDLNPGENLTILRTEYLYTIFKDMDTISEL